MTSTSKNAPFQLSTIAAAAVLALAAQATLADYVAPKTLNITTSTPPSLAATTSVFGATGLQGALTTEVVNATPIDLANWPAGLPGKPTTSGQHFGVLTQLQQSDGSGSNLLLSSDAATAITSWTTLASGELRKSSLVVDSNATLKVGTTIAGGASLTSWDGKSVVSVSNDGNSVTGTTNINTTGTAATNVGNTTSGTVVAVSGGTANASFKNNAAALGVTGGGNLTTTDTNAQLTFGPNNVNVKAGGTTVTGKLIAADSAIVNNSLTAYSLTGTGNSLVVDTYSSRFVSADTKNFITTNNDGNNIQGLTNNVTGTTNNITGTTNTVKGATNTIVSNVGNTAVVDATSSRFVSADTKNWVATNNTGNNVYGVSNTITAAAGHTAVVDATSSRFVSGDTKNWVATNNAGNVINGVTNTVTGTTNINTTGTAATTIGNSTAATTVRLDGGNANVWVANNSVNLGVNKGGQVSTGVNQASITSGGSNGGLMVYQNAQTIVAGTGGNLTNGNSVSQALLNGQTFNNRLQGNTLVDGNMYINGTLNYTSNTSATTTVSNGTSILAGATRQTTGSLQIANGGAAGTVSQLTLTNGMGVTNGVRVFENQTVISGGTSGTQIQLQDNQVIFSNTSNGSPTKLTGVAAGTSEFDAVNYGQYKDLEKTLSRGVASIAAIANIPQVDQGKSVSVGVGVGSFNGESAYALGVSVRAATDGVIKASVASGRSGKSTFGAGAAWSF